jgi:NADH-quinone oxidoreductase subunit L
LWLVGLTVSGLTAFYMFRAVFLTFFGASRVPDRLVSHVHEPPLSMSSVLVVLALGALLAGFIGLPQAWIEIAHVSAPFYDFLAPVLPPIGAEHHAIATEFALMAIAVLVALAGICFAWIRFGPRVQRPLARESSQGYMQWVVSRGYFFDSFYEGVIVRVIDWLSASVLARGLEAALAKITLTTSADVTRYVSTLFARLQTGNVQAYAFYALLGLALALWWGAAHA